MEKSCIANYQPWSADSPSAGAHLSLGVTYTLTLYALANFIKLCEINCGHINLIKV